MRHLINFVASSYGQAIILIVLLMIEGLVLKYSEVFDKISNQIIPFILMGTSVIVVGIYSQQFSWEEILTGLTTAIIATGTHQVGKITWQSIAANFISNLRTEVGAPDIGNVDALGEKNQYITNDMIDNAKKISEGIQCLSDSIAQIAATAQVVNTTVAANSTEPKKDDTDNTTNEIQSSKISGAVEYNEDAEAEEVEHVIGDDSFAGAAQTVDSPEEMEAE